MVTFVVETGANIPEANSLVSVEYADDYFSVHPFYADNWDDLLLEKKQNLLIFATAQICGMVRWGGLPAYAAQSLPWPRAGVPTPDGFYYASSVIPDALKRAVCEQAYYLSTPDANPDGTDPAAGIEELGVDVIKIKFGPSSKRQPVPQAVARLLQGLGAAPFGSRVRRVQVDLG